jgi:RNA polymerase sigma factor (sigma-70 family)
MEQDIEALVSAAKEGDGKALEGLVLRIQDSIYGLALHMLYNPADAEDASQEILIKIITNLGTFRGESSFMTWAYRVAANHLLTARKRRAELSAVSFEEYEKSCDLKSASNWQESGSEPLQRLFVEEIRISCLQGLLLCLDRGHRLAYLLADVFDVSSEHGAAILEITPSAFRKRLSRARGRIRDFLTKKCSLIKPGNPCNCEGHAFNQLDTGRFDDKNMVFAKHPSRVKDAKGSLHLVKEMDELNQISILYKHNPDFSTPAAIIESIKVLINSKKYKLL